MKTELTASWEWERLAPYGRQITSALRRLEARFPKDMNAQVVVEECAAGDRDLWLVLHDDDSFASVMLSRLSTNSGTGTKALVITSLAGEDGIEATALLPVVEEHARKSGADEIQIIGRLGWKRALAKQGYGLDFAYFRKDLSDE